MINMSSYKADWYINMHRYNSFFSLAGTSDPLGKKLNNVKTREEIGWEPKYPSFANFLGLWERWKSKES